MKRIFSTLILACTSIYICAAPSDHGRELGEPSSISIFLGRILLVAIVIVGLGILFGSKKSDNAQCSDLKPRKKRTKEDVPSYPYHCVHCEGRGYNYGEEVSSADSGYTECTSCYGTGKILSSKAKELLNSIGDFQVSSPQRREQERVEYEKSKIECEKKEVNYGMKYVKLNENTHIYIKRLLLLKNMRMKVLG